MDSSVGVATRQGLDGPGFQYRQEIFLFSGKSKPVLGPSLPPMKWVPGSFPGRNVDHSPPSTAEVKNKWNYTSPPPIWVYGVYRAIFTFTANRRFPEALQFGCLKQLGQQCVRSEQHEQAGRTLSSGVWVCSQFVLATLSVARSLNHLMIR